MLTNLIERGRNKCELYFPLGKTHQHQSFFCVKTTKIEDKFTFENNQKPPEEITIKFEELNEISVGRFKITHQKQETLGDSIVLRRLKLSDGRENREIQHYWFANWQDHKMANPEHVLDLAKMILNRIDCNRLKRCGAVDFTAAAAKTATNRAKRSKSGEEMDKRPIVVHCSAGIGRTGCFLAVLNGMQQLRNNRNVDVLAILCSLRLNRGGLVQTAEQYELVHRVLKLYCDELLVP